MQIIVFFLISYLIGSIPTAFLILKKVKSIDIRKHGSGNVGTLNSYEVSNSKIIGIIVLFIDLLKGIAVVLITKSFFDKDFLILISALNIAVFGHCYSVWLKFKGGRGLATAAGGALIIFPTILLLWLIVWITTYILKKHIHLSNILATVTVMLSSIIWGNFLNNFSTISANSVFIFSFSVSLLMIIILSKHISPFFEIINQSKAKSR